MSAIERGVYAPPLRRDPGFGPIDPHVDEPRRGPMVLFVSVVVLLALVGVIWSTYHQGVRERDEPAQLAAPAEPYKVAPADPGGEQAEHLGIEVFNVLEDAATRVAIGPSVEVPIEEPPLPGVEAIEEWEVVEPHGTDVLSADVAPEQDLGSDFETDFGPSAELAAAEPADAPLLGEQIAEDAALGPPIAGGLTAEEMAAAPPEEAVATAEEAEATGPIPRVKPLPRDPDAADDAAGPRTLATASDPSRRYFALREPMTRPSAAVEAAAEEGAAEPATAGSPAPLGVAPSIAPSAAAPVTAIPAAAIAPPPARIAVPGSFLVQLASFRSADAADVAWRQFRSEFDDLIGGYAPDVERADLGDRGVHFRLRIGIFTDRTAASSFCDEVKTRGRECLVVGG